MITVGCGPLSDPQNGRVQFSSTTIGSTADYTCNPDFILQGTATRTCQTGGWTPPTEPSCMFACLLSVIHA